METKFRPGPWRRSLPDETVVVDRNGTEVAAIQGDYDVDWERMFEITNLIAAAPEMYEALRACLNYIENTESEFGIKLNSGDMARAALAKAEGK